MSEQTKNGMVRTLGSWEFDDAIRRDETVLAVFSADRCSHCRAMEPILAQFAEENPGIPVYRIDADREIALAVRMEVRGIPTLVLFRNGREVDRVSGTMDKSELFAFANGELAGER